MSESKSDQTDHQTVDILKYPDAWHPEVRSVSRTEQCRWRLEKLLGKGSEVAGMGNEEDEFTMDSICTEDFSARFRDEMLDLTDKGTQRVQRQVVTDVISQENKKGHFKCKKKILFR